MDELLVCYIERLSQDEAFRSRVDQAKRDFLAQPGIEDHLPRLRETTCATGCPATAGRLESRVRRKLAAAAAALGASLADNPALRDSLNEYIERASWSPRPELCAGSGSSTSRDCPLLERWMTRPRDRGQLRGRETSSSSAWNQPSSAAASAWPLHALTQPLPVSLRDDTRISSNFDSGAIEVLSPSRLGYPYCACGPIRERALVTVASASGSISAQSGGRSGCPSGSRTKPRRPTRTAGRITAAWLPTIVATGSASAARVTKTGS